MPTISTNQDTAETNQNSFVLGSVIIIRFLSYFLILKNDPLRRKIVSPNHKVPRLINLTDLVVCYSIISTLQD